MTTTYLDGQTGVHREIVSAPAIRFNSGPRNLCNPVGVVNGMTGAASAFV